MTQTLQQQQEYIIMYTKSGTAAKVMGHLSIKLVLIKQCDKRYLRGIRNESDGIAVKRMEGRNVNHSQCVFLSLVPRLHFSRTV